MTKRLPHLLWRVACVMTIAGAVGCGPTKDAGTSSGGASTGGTSTTPPSTPTGTAGGGGAATGTPLDLNVTYTGASPNCRGSMLLKEQKAFVPHSKHIVWHLDGSACTSFDPQLACLDFADDVIRGGRHLCGVGSAANPKIEGTVTANMNPPYQNLSAHTYDLIYNSAPAGDPELDINDGGGGVPPTN